MGETRRVCVGRIEVICGCMFSGKTEALIQRVSDARAAGVRVAVFKHPSDIRYDPLAVISHTGRRLPAELLACSADLTGASALADLIAIDEAQFFDESLPGVCRALAAAGKRVILAGLDRDSWGLPFGPMPVLIEAADEVTRLTGRCARCGEAADFTQRTAPIEENMVGGPEKYEPRCSRCFVAPPIALRR